MTSLSRPSTPLSHEEEQEENIRISHGKDLLQSEEHDALEALERKALTIVILGASGDLAKKKIFPSLMGLDCFGLLPHSTHIVGYSRSHMTKQELVERIRPTCTAMMGDFESFAAKIEYHAGAYDSRDDFTALNAFLTHLEGEHGANRMFYLAVPPSVFGPAAHAFQPVCFSSSGWNRVVVEKPFGHDLDSSRELVASLAEVLREEQQFRIDHYLGKEMVQNLLVMRFSNLVFQPIWSHHYIDNIMITFKEPFGTEGRGGYFDSIGIIRDVMQNHLLQVLSLVAMERPVSLDAEAIRDEKVKVLRAVRAIKLSDLVLGQYTASKDGSKPAYTDDKTVPAGSRCATFATAILRIDNERWDGVPFILKCGKALDERKAVIRIQFKSVPGQLFSNAARNELVIEIQPNESTYLKFNVKKPGLANGVEQSELDLSYSTRWSDIRLPDAYERLLFDVIKGDHSQFVRADELDVAWRIFTPVLQQIEQQQIVPIPYAYGSRGPPQADQLAASVGFVYSSGYKWKPYV